MGPRHERQIWDERKLKRLAAGRADGVSAAELAVRFGVTCPTIERKLAELRTRSLGIRSLGMRTSVCPEEWMQFLDNPFGHPMKPGRLG